MNEKDISKEKYLDIFLSVLVDIMVKNNYENLNMDQIMVIRNELRDYSEYEILKLGGYEK